jgi:hypothetical protein
MYTYLRRVAIGLNAVLLLAVAIAILSEPGGATDGRYILFVVLLVVTPAFTLFVLCAPHPN